MWKQRHVKVSRDRNHVKSHVLGWGGVGRAICGEKRMHLIKRTVLVLEFAVETENCFKIGKLVILVFYE